MRNMEDLSTHQWNLLRQIIDAKQPIVIFSTSLTKEELQSRLGNKEIKWFDCKSLTNLAELTDVLSKDNSVIVLEHLNESPEIFASMAEKKNDFRLCQTNIPLTKELVKKTLIDEAKRTLKTEKPFANVGKNKDELQSTVFNIKKYPHLFVLGCLMDKQITAERAWAIPLKVCKETNKWSVDELSTITKEEIIDLFETNHLHRFNKGMAEIFVLGVKKIKEQYGGDASRIWRDNPTSAEVVYRFLEFKGAGIKIATMAANILQRDFSVPFSDLSAIDVSPDIQVRRVLYRLGLIEDENNVNMAVYMAKAINPEFPGLIDYPCWLWGRDYCHPQSPECDKCPLATACIYNLEKTMEAFLNK